MQMSVEIGLIRKVKLMNFSQIEPGFGKVAGKVPGSYQSSRNDLSICQFASGSRFWVANLQIIVDKTVNCYGEVFHSELGFGDYNLLIIGGLHFYFNPLLFIAT